MSDKTINLSEHSLALLALQLKDQNPPVELSSEIVSDDNLMALYRGDLSDEMRTQVLHHIANDSDTYSRWLSLVESTHEIDFNEELSHERKTEKHPVVTPVSTDISSDTVVGYDFWGKVKQTLHSWSTPVSYGGGALATFAIAFFFDFPDATQFYITDRQSL